MASKPQICNMALSRLGASTITSLTDATTEAKLCNTLFDDLADRVMIQGSWATTIKREELARTVETPEFGFTYAFQLPTSPKCLKVLNVNTSVPGDIEYKIEGDKLLTDESSIKIRYIGRLEDTEDYGTLLTEAVEILLASYLAMSITGDSRLAARLREEYQAIISLNLAIDGQQGSKGDVVANDLTVVR